MPTIAEILQQLKLRLLDLTARNRLLNFKPSVTKSLQIVDAVPNPNTLHGRCGGCRVCFKLRQVALGALAVMCGQAGGVYCSRNARCLTKQIPGEIR